MTNHEAELVRRIRILLRDFNPDANPPLLVDGKEVFGYLWTDEELLEYLKLGLDLWNSYEPETQGLATLDLLCEQKPVWCGAVIWQGIDFAITALAFGGLEGFPADRKAKYRAVQAEAKEQFKKMVELKKKTTKYIGM